MGSCAHAHQRQARYREEFISSIAPGLFGSLKEARHITEAWRIDYNTERPHTNLSGLTPIAFANRSQRDQNPNNSPYE
jgi:transposase InsO family protein